MTLAPVVELAAVAALTWSLAPVVDRWDVRREARRAARRVDAEPAETEREGGR